MQPSSIKTMFKVTVLLPVYNGQSYIKHAVASLASQTFSDFECLIINDASTDSTAHIIKSFKDKRFKTITNSANLGIAQSLNLGIRISRGQYIARMDADDLSLPDRLKLQVKYLDDHPLCGLVSSSFFISNNSGEIIATSAPPLHDSLIKAAFIFQNPFPHSAVMFRKEVLKKHNLEYNPNANFHEDYDLWSKLLPHTRFKVIKQPLLVWMKNKHGISCVNKNQANLAVVGLQSRIKTKIYKTVINKLTLQRLKLFRQHYIQQYFHLKDQTHLFDFEKKYQKLLFEIAKCHLLNRKIVYSAAILAYSFSIRPTTYSKKILNPFSLFSSTIRQLSPNQRAY